jgi:hypothetical protein
MRFVPFRERAWAPLLVFLALAFSPAWSSGQIPAPSESPRPIGLQDILAWKRIGGATLSPDGGWLAYRLSPTEGNSELVVRSTADTTEHRFSIGERGGAVTFSSDSRWLAFTIAPTVEERERAEEQRRPARNKAGLLDLASGEMTEFEDVSTFAFAGERGGWIALRKLPPAASGGGGAAGAAGGGNGAGGARGTDLILRDLSNGSELNIGNVGSFAFDDSGRWLAWEWPETECSSGTWSPA